MIRTAPKTEKTRGTISRTALYLVLIVLLAGVVRVVRALEKERYSTDVYLYFRMAEHWAYHGADYTYSYDTETVPPLLPCLMAAGYNCGLSPEHTGLIVGAGLGALLPLAAFWIALNLFSPADGARSAGRSYALLAALLVAVHPFLVRISVSCLREI
ncbi:MAG: hypothetical protein PHH77_02935, partial [Victivallaceae bacterium]|nr:hypothetical protein [Victivallaceae bacterium]